MRRLLSTILALSLFLGVAAFATADTTDISYFGENEFFTSAGESIVLNSSVVPHHFADPIPVAGLSDQAKVQAVFDQQSMRIRTNPVVAGSFLRAIRVYGHNKVAVNATTQGQTEWDFAIDVWDSMVINSVEITPLVDLASSSTLLLLHPEWDKTVPADSSSLTKLDGAESLLLLDRNFSVVDLRVTLTKPNEVSGQLIILIEDLGDSVILYGDFIVGYTAIEENALSEPAADPASPVVRLGPGRGGNGNGNGNGNDVNVYNDLYSIVLVEFVYTDGDTVIDLEVEVENNTETGDTNVVVEDGDVIGGDTNVTVEDGDVIGGDTTVTTTVEDGDVIGGDTNVIVEGDDIDVVQQGGDQITGDTTTTVTTDVNQEGGDLIGGDTTVTGTGNATAVSDTNVENNTDVSGVSSATGGEGGSASAVNDNDIDNSTDVDTDVDNTATGGEGFGLGVGTGGTASGNTSDIDTSASADGEFDNSSDSDSNSGAITSGNSISEQNGNEVDFCHDCKPSKPCHLHGRRDKIDDFGHGHGGGGGKGDGHGGGHGGGGGGSTTPVHTKECLVKWALGQPCDHDTQSSSATLSGESTEDGTPAIQLDGSALENLPEGWEARTEGGKTIIRIQRDRPAAGDSTATPESVLDELLGK